MIRTIELCGRPTAYWLERKKVKNINLRIKPDGTVRVSANRRVPLAVIEAFMLSREKYIIDALDRFASLEKSAVRHSYENGEAFTVCGREVVLQIRQGSKNRVEEQNGIVYLTVKEKENTELKKKLVEDWIRSEFAKFMEEICRKIYPHFEKQGVPFPQLRFRKMKSRWGSCIPMKGIITFNTALAGAPVECIEYVAAHEFTHFLRADHSAKFYEKLTAVMPDWKERKRQLSNCFNLLDN